jgi:hypothetical protein
VQISFKKSKYHSAEEILGEDKLMFNVFSPQKCTKSSSTRSFQGSFGFCLKLKFQPKQRR